MSLRSHRASLWGQLLLDARMSQFLDPGLDGLVLMEQPAATIKLVRGQHRGRRIEREYLLHFDGCEPARPKSLQATGDVAGCKAGQGVCSAVSNL